MEPPLDITIIIDISIQLGDIPKRRGEGRGEGEGGREEEGEKILFN